jgi:integrase
MPDFAFTQKRLADLKPPETGRYRARDTRQPGLVVVVTAAGSKTFYVYRKVDGRPLEVRLGTVQEMSLDAARTAAQDALAALHKGVDPRAEKRARRREATLADLWEQYLTLHAKMKKRTWRDDERQYQKYLAPLHNRRLSEITDTVVAKWHATVAKEHGPIQANRCKALLATMFSKASKHCGYAGPNPCAGVENFPEQDRERFLLPAEMERFFRALAAEDAYWQGFFLLCLFTASRRGNVASMEWAELDLENAVWHIPATKTKNKRPTSISLCAPALAILRTRYEQRNGSPYVFPSRQGGEGHLMDPRKAWARITAAADVDDLHIHDLRRSQASWQAALGFSLAIIGKALGHADLKSTQVYSRLQLDPVKEAVSKASDAMLDAAGVVVDGNGVKMLEAPAVEPIDAIDTPDSQ